MAARPLSRQTLSRASLSRTPDSTSYKSKKQHLLEMCDYDGAAALSEEIVRAKQEAQEMLVRQEEARQEDERKAFEKAMEVRQKQFEGSLQAEQREAMAYCQEKMSKLLFQHECQRENLIRELESRPMAKPVMPPYFRDMIKDEKLYRAGGRYAEAKELHERIETMKIEAEEASSSQGQARAQKQWDALCETQASEVAALQRKLDIHMRKFNMDTAEARKIMWRNRQNLRSRMDHAHKLEFIAPKETATSVLSAHKSRATTSSTFAGTLLHSMYCGIGAGVAAPMEDPTEKPSRRRSSVASALAASAMRPS